MRIVACERGRRRASGRRRRRAALDRPARWFGGSRARTLRRRGAWPTDDARVGGRLADADEAIHLRTEVVGPMQTLDDAHDRIRATMPSSPSPPLRIDPERLAQVHQLLHALEHVERFQLARAGRLPALESSGASRRFSVRPSSLPAAEPLPPRMSVEDARHAALLDRSRTAAGGDRPVRRRPATSRLFPCRTSSCCHQLRTVRVSPHCQTTFFSANQACSVPAIATIRPNAASTMSGHARRRKSGKRARKPLLQPAPLRLALPTSYRPAAISGERSASSTGSSPHGGK